MQAITAFDELPGPSGLGPETRVLCADFTWQPLSTVRVGDAVVAYDQEPVARGKHRKLRIATIVNRQQVKCPSLLIRFADGREMVASSGHSWLSARSGRGPRIMACDQCGLPFKNWQGLSSHRRWMHGAPGIWQQQGFGTWITTGQIRPGTTVKDLGVPWGTDRSYEAGYLGGVFDGEASLQNAQSQGSFCIMFAQKPGQVLEYTRQTLKEKGFREYDGTFSAQSGVVHLPIRGVYDCFRFLGQCRPLRLLEKTSKWLDGLSPFNRHGAGSIAIESVEPCGDRESVAVSTSTGTLFAEGLFSRQSG